MGCAQSKPSSPRSSPVLKAATPSPATRPLPPHSAPRSSAASSEGGGRPSSASSAPPNSTLPAFVLCDFAAEPNSSELSVRRGQFVDVFVGEVPAPPEGWCTCRLRKEGGSGEERGLVPWTHLVSAVHAELDAIAENQPGAPATPPHMLGAADGQRTVPVRRTARGFGIDVSEKNIIVRIVPNSAAHEDGYLRVGDVIYSVDGEVLDRRWLPHVLDTLPRRPVHTFVVVAEEAELLSRETPGRLGKRRKNVLASARSGRSSAQSTAPREYDILSTMDLSNIYSLKSWDPEAVSRSATKYQYFSYEGRDVPIELEGLPSATVAAGAATRGGRMCAPSEVLSAASRLHPEMPAGMAAGVRAAPISRIADPDLAAAQLFSSLDPMLAGDGVLVHALWLVDVQQDLVTGALAQAVDRSESERGRGAAEIIKRINTLRRDVPFEIVCMSMRATGGTGSSARQPRVAEDLTRDGYEVEVPVAIDSIASSSVRFYGYSRKEVSRVLQHMVAHKVTHVWVCGLAPEGAVLVSALHAAEAGLVTVILSDCSRACSLTAAGGIDAQVLQRAAIPLVESTDVKELRRLSSPADATAAARKVAEVRELISEIGADTGTLRPLPAQPVMRDAVTVPAPPPGYESLPTEGSGAVYRIAGDTVPSWVFAQLQERETRRRFQEEEHDRLQRQQQEQQFQQHKPPPPPLGAPPMGQTPRRSAGESVEAARATADSEPAELAAAAPAVATSCEAAADTGDAATGPGHRRTASAGGRKLAVKSKPFWEIKEERKYRQPPKASELVSTMRMGQMLEEARKGAEADGTPEAKAYFDQVLSRYNQHPSVMKRMREQEAAAAEAAQRVEEEAVIADVEATLAALAETDLPVEVEDVTPGMLDAAAIQAAGLPRRSSRDYSSVSSTDTDSSEDEAPLATPTSHAAGMRLNTPKLNLGKLKEEEAFRSEKSVLKAQALLLPTLNEGGSLSTLGSAPSPQSSTRGSDRTPNGLSSATPEGSTHTIDRAAIEESPGGLETGTVRIRDVPSKPMDPVAITPTDGGGAKPKLSFALDLDARGASPSPPQPAKPLRGTSSEGGSSATMAALVGDDVDEASIHSISTRDSLASRGSRHSGSSADGPRTIAAGSSSQSEVEHTGTTPSRDQKGEGSHGTAKEQRKRRKTKYSRKTVLTKHLGAGSCGSVYVGMCDDEEVAVKVLPLEDDTAGAIKQEIRILRECECEYIVAYKDAFMRDYHMRPSLWVVMEFCHGGSLLDVMRKMGSSYTEPCIATICDSVLRALHYMHVQRKAIHRDIKSANVLLTADGRVKLADLGVVAQLVNTMSKRGTMIGTPHWMAPETLGLAGSAKGYDTKVDIWSLGITAIECAEQKPPFSNTNSIYETMMHIVQGPPATLAPETMASPDFQDFIAAALVKDPAQRPTAADLLTHPFLRRASQEQLKGVVQYVLGGAPHDGITTI